MLTTRIEAAHPSDLTPDCLIGRQLQSIDASAAPCWVFHFDGNVHLTVECAWRLVTAQACVAASPDHAAWVSATRQLDACAPTLAAIAQSRVREATLRQNTCDLALYFENECELHVIVLSTVRDEWTLWKPDGTQLVAADGKPVQLHRFLTSPPSAE